MDKLNPIEKKKIRKVVLLSSIGGTLEFYDFIIYALFAGAIADKFFPSDNNLLSMIATFATFSVGYLARPLGGIFFGHIGDTLGRKTTFTLTVFMMATATLLIGLVPSYQEIGIYAPIVIIALRLLQGFSVGGEIPGAITYLSEVLPKRKGLLCGIVFFGLINGIVLGFIVHAILNASMTEVAVNDWGWRLAFIAGGILGCVSYFFRRRFYESPLFSDLEQRQRIPVIIVFKQHGRALLTGTSGIALGAGLIVILFLLMPAYLGKVLHYPIKSVIWLEIIALFISTIWVVFFGWLSDRVSRRWLLLAASILTIIAAYPIFYLYSQHASLVFPLLIISPLLLGMVFGNVPAILADSFPTSVRYTGVGVAYNIAFALFGGLAPLIAIALIHWTKQNAAPSYYLIALGIIGVIGTLTYQKNTDNTETTGL